jgi:hypothetical protein
MIRIGTVGTWFIWVKSLRIVGRTWCPTNRRSILYRKIIKIIKMKIHTSPLLFNMQIFHINRPINEPSFGKLSSAHLRRKIIEPSLEPMAQAQLDKHFDQLGLELGIAKGHFSSQVEPSIGSMTRARVKSRSFNLMIPSSSQSSSSVKSSFEP